MFTGSPGSRSPAVILTGTIAAAMLVVANVSVLNVALPELSVELGASQAQNQWMVDIYAVVLASLLLPVGAIGDRYGRRLILLIGLTILMVANAATIGLDTANQVIIARAISGVGAAFVFPATLSTITATLPPEKRSRGVAMWTAAIATGGFLGIILSGVLIENFWWGSLFVAMALITAAVLLFCVFAVPDSSDPEESNLDPVGGLLSVAAVGGLVLGIIEGPVEGWTSPLALSGLVVGVMALIGFVVWELKTPRPLLDVRLFSRPGLRAGSLSVFVQFVGAFGIFFLVVFYLAVVLGYGPLDIGLALLPIAAGLLPASAVAIPLANRFGRRAVGTFGMTIMGLAFAYGTTIDVDDGLREYLITLVGMGIGYGFAGPPTTEAIVESLPQAKQGVASALNDVLRELGAAIGIAMAGSAFNSAYRSGIDDLAYPDEVIEAVKETPFAVAPVAESLGEGGAQLVADVQQAVIDGWSLGLWTLAGAMAVGTVGFAWWAPGKSGWIRAEDEVAGVD
ncbi:MAG: MFS transporter, partial [Acidimicrobiales bacterium]